MITMKIKSWMKKRKIISELGLKEQYPYPKDEFNAFLYLKNVLKENPPSMAWNGTSVEEHKEWKKQARDKLKQLLAYEREGVSLNPEFEKEVEFDNVILKRVTFSTAPHLRAVGILAYSKSINKPAPAILTLHGHNKGKICPTGLAPSKSNSYYGIELAREGFITLSLDQWGWGERTGRYKKTEGHPEETFSRASMLLGQPALGIRAWDASRALDLLETLDFCNKKFGIIGQSGGGATSTYASALDDRIEAAVISGHFCSFEYGLMAISHCSCAYVPGLLKYFEIADIVGIRAPKPTFIVSGEYDHIFPQDGVQVAFKKLQSIYQLYNKEKALGIDVIKDKGHYFRGTFAYPWLSQQLMNQET
ncbi:MAG: hypothetical protein GF364_17635 [Candidatus Lokiarchaeota archaeon]|nr:hypothetical protein [Candidatus Lokiarchaeota archaeon]